jgi:hypothetical protein
MAEEAQRTRFINVNAQSNGGKNLYEAAAILVHESIHRAQDAKGPPLASSASDLAAHWEDYAMLWVNMQSGGYAPYAIVGELSSMNPVEQEAFIVANLIHPMWRVPQIENEATRPR